jgi:8-amino-7-oxononanoate synthase
MEGPVGAVTIINGRPCDYFAGTGYLGLQNHPEVVAAAADALQRYGVSTATSRGGLGEHPLYEELEREARAYFDCEKVLYFSSGYLGQTILTQGESRSGDHIFIDAAAHYSLWDAARALGLVTTPFRHRDPSHLREVIRQELTAGERPLILTDGIFPISGEIAPLPEYLEVAAEFGGLVFVDDAHALGVLGDFGRGTGDHFNIQSPFLRTSASLAKAMGGFGGLIWGRADWIDRLDQSSSFVAGASPPPLVVTAASAAGLRLARQNPVWRDALRKNVARARAGLKALGFEIESSPSPILCVPAASGLDLPRVRDGLFLAGIAVAYVRGYTSTPTGGALRITVFATHTPDQIDRLLHTLASLM